MRRAPLSARSDRRVGFGLLSGLLHAGVIGVLIMAVSRPLEPPPPEQVTVEMVFEAVASPPEVQPPPQAEPPLPEPVPAPPPPTPELTPPPELEAPPKALSPRPKPPPPPRQAVRQRAPSPASQAVTVAPVPVLVPPMVDPNWQAAVSGWLASRKTYPEDARRRGEEGRVAVRFTVDRSGRVVDATIVAASGSATLDDAALGLLRQAVLPAFPADMTQTRITITTTMRYSLR